MSGPIRRFRTSRASGVCLTALALAGAACTGAMSERPGDNSGRGGGSPVSGTGGARGGTGGAPGTPGAGGAVNAPGACAPLPIRVARLTDRHLSNAIKDLLSLEKAPEIVTGTGGHEEFVPNKPAALNGSVALKLRDIAEAAAAEATGAGKPAVRCTGAEADCARAFIDRFASRAFRRPVTAEERDKLLVVYESGKTNYGGHAGGIRLVIEAVLQTPMFLYQSELGVAQAGGRRKLTPFETAAKLSFFLRDSVPDDGLWKAAEEGRLATKEGIGAEVDRLMALPEVKANITRMLARLFQLDRIFSITKAAEIKEFTPALAQAMYNESRAFIDDTLWKSGGKLSTLLTSRKTIVDKSVASLYGVTYPGTAPTAEIMGPADQRAGLLTHPSIMAIEALPNESSVVHRGVFVARELLCFFPPPPAADDLTAGEALKKQEPTERGRAEKRLMVARCSGCHAFFDPLGVTFENYDTLGRYRKTIPTPTGPVPVNASWNLDVYDVKGTVASAVELARKLAESKAVQQCMVRQVASYALTQRVTDDENCTLSDANTAFDMSGGDLTKLVKAVATWDGLRERQEGAAQ